MSSFFFRLLIVFFVSFYPLAAPAVASGGVTVLALGDSLTAGYGLRPEESFPAQLETALRARLHEVTFINGGVSGDTTAGGKARLEWVLEQNPQLVIVALGANDMLRGVPTATTRANLDSILHTLTQKNIAVVFAGQKASMNLGPKYASDFNKIYPELAEKYDVEFFPFFLQDVALKPELNLPDGIHPNAKGIEVMVTNILPVVEKALARVKPQSATME